MTKVKAAGISTPAIRTEKIVFDGGEIPTNRIAYNSIGNPNILINTDFKNPIDQRGMIGVSQPVDQAYSIDRWCSPGDSTITQVPEGIRVTFDGAFSGYRYFYQFVEFHAACIGRTYTYSIRIRANRPFVYCYLGIKNVGTQIPVGTEWSTIIITRTVDVGASKLLAGIRAANPVAGDWFEIEWVKMEEGPVATPWQVPDPTIELARCQRYFQAISGTNKIIGHAVRQGVVTFSIAVPLPTVMRAMPAFSLTGYYGLWAYGHTFTNQTSIVLSSTGSGPQIIQLNANVNTTVPDGREVYALTLGQTESRFNFDAEI